MSSRQGVYSLQPAPSRKQNTSTACGRSRAHEGAHSHTQRHGRRTGAIGWQTHRLITPVLILIWRFVSASAMLQRYSTTLSRTVTGWLGNRVQSTGGARTILISILVCENTQCLGAVRGVCCIYQ